MCWFQMSRSQAFATIVCVTWLGCNERFSGWDVPFYRSACSLWLRKSFESFPWKKASWSQCAPNVVKWRGFSPSFFLSFSLSQHKISLFGASLSRFTSTAMNVDKCVCLNGWMDGWMQGQNMAPPSHWSLLLGTDWNFRVHPLFKDKETIMA